MDIFEEEEITDYHMVHNVVNMFERNPYMQRLVRLGLLGGEYSDDVDETREDKYDIDSLRFKNFQASKPPLRYLSAADFLREYPNVLRANGSDTERRESLLQETKKNKEKSQKKRHKKQKQKERKRLEKLDKEKQNPIKKEEGNDHTQQCKAEDNYSATENPKDIPGFYVEHLVTAKDTDSSDSSEEETSDEDSDVKNDQNDSEELDMESAFVKLAKLKLEQKPRPEKKEKKKVPGKEERNTLADKSNEDRKVEEKDSAAPRTPTLEENIKISTDFAVLGNKFAASGDYMSAVNYFTDAIKYNPTEYKLFGNRSFCFEKMREYEKALLDAELCLRLGPGWVKGLFRKGRALAGLKRYEEAAQALREVLKMDGSCAEAAQELMRVQITQLMDYGFTREQSSNALIIHGTVQKALDVLTKLNHQAGAAQTSSLLPAQVANVTGFSPVLSAHTSSTAAVRHESQDAPLKNRPVHSNVSNVLSQAAPVPSKAMKSSFEVNRTPLELFPVWVGNLIHPVPESVLMSLFSKVGAVYSVKILTIKRCAFVNFTKQEHCEEAIRRFHGCELNGMRIAVRYPDRIPHGIGISKSALTSEDLQDDYIRKIEYVDERNAVGGWRPIRPFRYDPNHRCTHKY